MFWNRFPLFRVFIFFSSGVLLANFRAIDIQTAGITFAICLLTGLLVLGLKSTLGEYYYPKIQGTAFLLLFASLGLALSVMYQQRWRSNHLLHHTERTGEWLVQITSEPKQKARSIGAETTLLGRLSEDSVQPLHTGLMLYLQNSPAARRLQYGDRLVVKARLNQLKGPANPYEFDYRNYLNLKAIYFQAYADSTSWILQNQPGGFGLKRIALAKRQELMQVIDNWQLSPAGKAVSKALLLGYRDELDDELLHAFSAAGAMHVLAVSGLHVGIIFIMAGSVLFFLNGSARQKIVKSILLVLILWLYALLTGLSASVVRAATMFSFVAIGSSFNRKTSVYNTILVSALFLMLIKPTYLFEVGFQLSYVAVFGIVWLQPKLARVWRPNYWLLDKFWSIVTVSIAAQIATFPLGLYYFHQFPALFLVSNILVIPLVTIMMYAGIACLMLGYVDFLPEVFLQAYRGLILALQASVQWVEAQSVFLINQIHLSRLELVLFYVIIGFFFGWLFSGKIWRLRTALLTTLVLMGLQWWENYQLRQSRQLVCYKTKGVPSVGLYAPHHAVFLSDPDFLADESALTFHVKHHWWALNHSHVKRLSWQSFYQQPGLVVDSGLIHFEGKNICFLNSLNKVIMPADLWLVDYTDPPEVDRYPDKVILLRSTQKQSKAWQKYCQRYSCEFINAAQAQGATVTSW